MANAFFSPNRQSGGPGGMRNVPKTPAAAPFKEKPGFPSAGLPGKTQSKDRSNGIKRLKTHPKSEGL